MYYLYQHIRNDNGSVFYVGIGDKHRPYEKSSRNKHWKNIVLKAGYTVEILRRCETWEEACDWEILLIWLYGTRPSGTGPLVNLTAGGDGTVGFKKSIDTLNKMWVSNFEKSIAIDAYDVRSRQHIGSYMGYAAAARSLGINQGVIYACVNGSQYHAKGYTFCRYGDTPDWAAIDMSLKTRKSPNGWSRHRQVFGKPIQQYSLSGDLIAEFETVASAAASVGKKHGGNIGSCANGKHDTAYGYKWKWKQ